MHVIASDKNCITDFNIFVWTASKITC